MSLPIPPVGRPEGPSGAGAVRSASPAKPAAKSDTTAEPAVHVDTFPSSPPPEVLQEIATARRAYEDLHAQGREVSFHSGEPDRRGKIELRDSDGNRIKTLSASETIELAAGKPLEAQER